MDKIELEVLKTIICAYHQAYEGYICHVPACLSSNML